MFEYIKSPTIVLNSEVSLNSIDLPRKVIFHHPSSTVVGCLFVCSSLNLRNIILNYNSVVANPLDNVKGRKLFKWDLNNFELLIPFSLAGPWKLSHG